MVCKSEIRELQKLHGPQIGNLQIATFAEGPQGRYDNPMPELTLSPQSGYMNSATGMRVTRRVSSKTCYLWFISIGKGEYKEGEWRDGSYTDKKENEILLIYKEIQMGSAA